MKSDEFLDLLESRLSPDMSNLSKLNVIFDMVDDKLIEGGYDTISESLLNIDIDKYSLDILIGFLSVTMPWKSFLTGSRDILIERVEKRADIEMGKKRTSNILSGFR